MTIWASFIWGVSNSSLGFIISIISGELESADRALIVLTEPLTDAVFVEEMAARHASGPFCQVFTTNGAPWVLFGGSVAWRSSSFAFFISYRNLIKAVDSFLACGRCAYAASLELWDSKNVLHETLIREERAEVQIHISEKWNVQEDKACFSLWLLRHICLRRRLLLSSSISPATLNECHGALDQDSIVDDILDHSMITVLIRNHSSSLNHSALLRIAWRWLEFYILRWWSLFVSLCERSSYP